MKKNLVAFALVWLVAGCSAGSPASRSAQPSGAPAPAATTAAGQQQPNAACASLPAEDVATLNDGAEKGVTVTGGAVLPLPDDLATATYKRITSATLSDGQTGLFILGADPGAGPIMAADDPARVSFSWGAAAQDGSPIAKWRDKVATSVAADEVAACPR